MIHFLQKCYRVCCLEFCFCLLWSWKSLKKKEELVLIENVRTVRRSVGDVLVDTHIKNHGAFEHYKIDSYLRFPLLVWLRLLPIPAKKDRQLGTRKHLKHVLCSPKSMSSASKKTHWFSPICYCHANNHALQLDFLLKKPA